VKRRLNIILFVLVLIEITLYFNFDSVAARIQDKRSVRGEEKNLTEEMPLRPLAEPLTTVEGVHMRGVKVVVDFAKLDKNADVDALWQNTDRETSSSSVKQVAAYTTTTHVDVISFIEKYSEEYNVDRDMMIIIAKCESGFRAEAVNGPYAGVYQFLTSTWVSNRNAMGLDPEPSLRFNAEESVRTAAFKMGRDGFSAWPTCSR
jgi:sulfur relay (sulfurtransferase) DsrC/TusE family protein